MSDCKVYKVEIYFKVPRSSFSHNIRYIFDHGKHLCVYEEKAGVDCQGVKDVGWSKW